MPQCNAIGTNCRALEISCTRVKIISIRENKKRVEFITSYNCNEFEYKSRTLFSCFCENSGTREKKLVIYLVTSVSFVAFSGLDANARISIIMFC